MNLALWHSETLLEINPLDQVDARISAPFTTMDSCTRHLRKAP
jgi:hypothetical protein